MTDQSPLSAQESGHRRNVITKTYPASADFSLEVMVNRDTGYAADGHDVVYYSAMLVPDEDQWREIAEEIAGDDELVSFKARALSQGRYWNWDAQYTTVKWYAPGASRG